jgi:hypothetical protein
MIKKYSYEAIDGTHFPDANVGDDLFYAIDISQWLSAEHDTLTSVAWVYPSGVTSSEQFLVGNEATIKVATNKTGSFKLICKITTVENGKTQINAIPMMLRVY